MVRDILTLAVVAQGETAACSELQSLADSPFLLEIPISAGGRKPQKTADFRRKPMISQKTAGNRTLGLRHLRSVTFSSALLKPTIGNWSCTGLACPRQATRRVRKMCQMSLPRALYQRYISVPLQRERRQCCRDTPCTATPSKRQLEVSPP